MQNIADIMTKDVITVKRETTVRELAKIFETRHFGSLPVVDDSGNLIGIVTASDLIEQGRNLHIPTVISLFDWVIPLGGERSLARDLQKINLISKLNLLSTGGDTNRVGRNPGAADHMPPSDFLLSRMALLTTNPVTQILCSLTST